MPRKPFEALTGESFEDAYGITQHDWNGRPDIPWMEVQARSRDVANAAIAQDKAEYDRAEAERIEWVKRGERAEELCDALREENAKLQSEAGNLREAFDEIAHLRKENERLKYEFEALDGLANEKHDKLSAQLAEAEKAVRQVNELAVLLNTWGPEIPAKVADAAYLVGEVAREFLAKAKP